MEDVKVFGLWASPFTQRVIWALKLKGVSFEYMEEDLANMSNLLLQYNPIHKKVPVLVHYEKPTAESMVILEYIEETWAHNPILPKKALERSYVRFWSHFIDQRVIAMMSFFRYARKQQEKAMKETLETLGVIEEHNGIGEKKFFGGNTIGLPDIALGWVSYTLVAMEDVIGFKFITADAFPHLHKWVKDFLDIPVVKENLPEHKLAVHYFKEKRDMFLANLVILVTITRTSCKHLFMLNV